MTAYNNMDRGFAGLPQGLQKKVISRLSTEEIAYGVGVFAADADDTKVSLTQTGELLGVSMATQKTPAKYEAKEPVNIMTEGHILVSVALAVNSQEQVYITPAGAWTNVLTANLATNYKFRGSTAGADLVEIEVIQKGAI